VTNMNLPDDLGHFGKYGGIFVAETLMAPIAQLREAYAQAQQDPAFLAELDADLRDYVGRPSPIYYAERLSREVGGAQIYLKREDLNHTGAHKINSAIGQALLAKRMGKTRIIAETGAGQHGVATATVATRLGLECVVFMGEVDIARQQPNVQRMRLLGAEIRAVSSGSKTLKDALNEAMRDWVTHVDHTHYVLGTAYGSHPYPMIVRNFHRIIGDEAREQILEEHGALPKLLTACVGGGSNAIGLFYAFLDDPEVKMVGVEAGGEGIEQGKHAARFQGGKLGVLQGTKSYVLQNDDGQVELTHSVSAGLDYAAVGPEHCFLKDIGRVDYTYATDKDALDAFQRLSALEGIIPALETAHGVAYAFQVAPTMSPDDAIIVNLSGRGDKDTDQAKKFLLD